MFKKLFEWYLKWRLKGMTRQGAALYCEYFGYYLGVVSIDGEAVFSPSLYIPNKVWVEINNGKVTKIDSIDD